MSGSSSSSSHEIDSQQMETLNASNDNYGGVKAEMKEPMDPTHFDNLLRASISRWRHEGEKGIWLKLPIKLSNLIHTAVKQGFWYHHAEPTYLMLVYWIPSTLHTLPANASHTVGVGACVINDKREILVVQENSGRFKDSDFWKLPTGMVKAGEDIRIAAVRELEEETEIKGKFLELLAVRQTHNSPKSDLFFVCMLKPLSFDIKKQNIEIAAAKWMPLEEYVAQPINLSNEQFKYIAKVCADKYDNKYKGFHGMPPTAASTSQRTRSCLYIIKDGFQITSDHSQ